MDIAEHADVVHRAAAQLKDFPELGNRPAVLPLCV